MRKTIIIAALVLTTAVSCNKTPNSPFAKKVADYALVTLETPDLSGITDNGKEVLNLYRFIAFLSAVVRTGSMRSAAVIGGRAAGMTGVV